MNNSEANNQHNLAETAAFCGQQPFISKTDSKNSSKLGFFDGIAAPWVGFQFMLDHPKLWRYGIWPLVVNLLITGFMLAILIGVGIYFFSNIHPWFGEQLFWRCVEVLAAILLLVVLLALAAAIWMALQVALCCFFYDLLARKVENQLGVQSGELKDLPILPQVIDSLKDLLVLIIINVFCLALQFIPLVGTTLGACGSYYFTASTLGLEYLAYPLAIRGLRRSERHRFCGKCRTATLGLGTSVTFLMIFPVINAVFLTTAVTGAVLMRRRVAEFMQ